MRFVLEVRYSLIMSERRRTEGAQTGRLPARRFTDCELSDFLLRACHDLRAPLRAVRAHTELLLRDAAQTAGLAERMGFIVDGARRIDLLVDALSSFSLALRIDSASFQPTPMDVVLRRVLAKLERELRANDAVVTHSGLPPVRGNPDRLMELLERLLRNAVRYRGPVPPRIQIDAAKQSSKWLFSVRDNGSGVDPEDVERIFEPFEHGHNHRAGPGMGLAICRVIVERHGGKIWAEPNAGNGTTFFFVLPAN